MTKRGRSREWQALAYPSAAQRSMQYRLVRHNNHNNNNPKAAASHDCKNRITGVGVSEKQLQQSVNLFPLQHHVVLACLRSMLILDGQVDGRTFQLTKLPPPRVVQMKKDLVSSDTNEDAVIIEDGTNYCHYDGSNTCIETAEELTQEVLRCALERYFEASDHCCSCQQIINGGDENDKTEGLDVPPSSSDSSNDSSNVDQDYCFCAAGFEKDFDLRTTGGDSVIQLSIDAEEYYRRKAKYFTHFLLSSFSDFVLRLFVDRGVCTVREKLESNIAALLFDVSHAMFAWQQTEKDVLESCCTQQGEVSHFSRNEIDAKIFDTLLADDERALKRIGGFQSNSLLPSALSIARLKARNMSWSRFATTLGGGLFVSHRVNFDRRMRSKRRKYSGDEISFVRPRSRSNSTVSYSSSGSSIRSRSNSSAAITDTDMSIASNGADNYLQLSIARTASKKWGVTLVREGKTCVVHNISDGFDAAVNNSEKEQQELPSQLQTGDVIVSFVDEKGQLFTTASSNYDSKEALWFDAAVNAFKRSQALCVTVKRVQAVSDF